MGRGAILPTLIMRYIISHEFGNNTINYVYSVWPTIEWTRNKINALRMHPDIASGISRKLMEMGMSHTITQIKDPI